MTQRNANMKALPIGNLPTNTNRLYLFIVATTDVVVTIDSGTPFTIPAGGHWKPVPCPTNALTLTGTGTLVTG